MSIARNARQVAGIVTAAALLAGGMGLAVPAVAAPAAFEPTLDYYACPPKAKPAGVKCARLTVPLDWQSPTDGRTTTIDVRVMRSEDGDGGLTFNPGGPGGSGIESFPHIYSLLPDEVVSKFDFVGWDPRGVGGSGPKLTGCSTPEPDLAPTGPIDWREFWKTTVDETEKSNSACMAANPDAAPYLGTWQVIRDLDAMRAALGYSAWNYWGMSYGTRIGNAYARTFPHRLRATIMDGSLPADETIYKNGTSFPASLQVTSELYPALAQPAATGKLRVIMNSLNSSVLTLPGGIEYTRWDWSAQYRTLLTSQGQYPGIRVYIDNLYTGITSTSPAERRKALKVVADIHKELSKMLDDGSKMGPILILVNCSDLHDRPTLDQLVTASEMIDDNYGVTMPPFIGNAASCAGLDPDSLSPAVPTGPKAVTLKNPPVFVLSTGDAATPWIWGRSLANVYTASSTISYNSTQHVAYLSTPSDCVNDPVTEYLLTLKRPPRNLGCAYVPGILTPLR